jgi:hypothetical protein
LGLLGKSPTSHPDHHSTTYTSKRHNSSIQQNVQFNNALHYQQLPSAGDPDIVSQASIDLQFLIQAGNARAQADEKMMSAGSPDDEHGPNQEVSAPRKLPQLQPDPLLPPHPRRMHLAMRDRMLVGGCFRLSAGLPPPPPMVLDERRDKAVKEQRRRLCTKLFLRDNPPREGGAEPPPSFCWSSTAGFRSGAPASPMRPPETRGPPPPPPSSSTWAAPRLVTPRPAS